MLNNKLSKKVIVPALVATLFVGASVTANANTVNSSSNTNRVVYNVSTSNLGGNIVQFNAKLATTPASTVLKIRPLNILQNFSSFRITTNNQNTNTGTPVPKTPQPEVAPAPVAPKPAAPTPVEPKPVQPAPVQPKPAEPAPVQPKPAEPAPEQPAKPTPEVKPEQPVNTSNAKHSLSAEEIQMIELVNQERQKAGLKPLTIDVDLAYVARVKSKDMHDNKYFSHQSPTYGSPFDMMRSFGIQYRGAAENIAKNNSVTAAHNAFMNSEGHRKNIMNPSLTHIGIGIYNGYYTQMFISK